MPEISVVIPVYNTAAYLQECVDSVLEQTFQDFEIIIVDDASTDDSLALCRRLYGDHPKVTILHHERNRTVGGARNTGLGAARGKYIAFIDSDDLYVPDALAILHQAAEVHRAEVVHSPGCLLPNGDTEHIAVGDDFREFRLDKLPIGKMADIISDSMEERVRIWAERGVSTAVWAKLFRRSFLEKHRIWFEEDIVPGQDGIFMFRCVLYGNPFVRIPENIYIYRRPASAVTRTERDGKFLAQLVRCMARKIESLDRYMQDEAWFKNRPDMQEMVRSFAISDTDPFFAQDCYLEDGTVAGDVGPVHQAFQDLFGRHAWFAEYFFHASHQKKTNDVAEWGLRMNYMFPWHLFSKGSRIVLYGAGEVGRNFYEQVLRFPYVDLVGIVDKRAGQAGMKGLPAKEPADMLQWDFDYVLITVVNSLVAGEIRRELAGMGVSEEKIRWDGKKYPIEDYYQDYYFPFLEKNGAGEA